jgi:hypothetical protein
VKEMTEDKLKKEFSDLFLRDLDELSCQQLDNMEKSLEKWKKKTIRYGKKQTLSKNETKFFQHKLDSMMNVLNKAKETKQCEV